ncbi:hypothetical protein WEI85_07765 [Actinomycetes bacterium KLBMP 9797]
MTTPADPAAHRISDLPDGVDLASTLAEDDARQLIAALAVHYGWAYVLWDRANATTVLREDLDIDDEEVTDEEWQRVIRTPAWDEIAEVARRGVDINEVIPDALVEAGLQCWRCSRRLTAPPSVTGRLCQTHRVGPHGQPATVDPATEGLFWLVGRALYYAAPRATDNAPSRDGALVDFAELDPIATAQALDAHARLDAITTVTTGEPAGPDPSTGWTCVCGNTAGTLPFRPCDAAGQPVDAASPQSWLCPACGRIIDPTGVIVARTDRDER